MDFEITRGAVSGFEMQDELSAEELFDMMLGVIKDVLRKNRLNDVRKIRAKNSADFAKYLYPLMKSINDMYAGNKDQITDVREEILQRLDSYAENSRVAQSDLSELLNSMYEVEVNKQTLENEYREIEKTRGHLLKLDAECEKLRQSVERLNDAGLDRLADEKAGLEKDLSERTERQTRLEDHIRCTKEQLEAAEGKIESLEDKLFCLQDKSDMLNQRHGELEVQKDRMEQEIGETEEKITQLTRWMEDFTEKNNEKTKEYERLRKIETAYVSAWNALNQEEWVREHLFSAQSQSAELNVKDYRDLEEQFSVMTEKARGLLEVYRKRLNVLVELAESLTR